MNKRCANRLSSSEIENRANASKISNVIETRSRNRRDLVRIRNKTGIASWGWRKNRDTITQTKCRTLYFIQLRLETQQQEFSLWAVETADRFEVIQSAMEPIQVFKQEMLSLNLVVWKDMNSWVSSAYRWWLSPNEEMSELSGVVYDEKRRGPKTEPWGTPWWGCESSPEHFTQNDLSER